MPHLINYVSSADINECTELTHNCSSFSVCENTNGSFNCNCDDEYAKDGNGVCKREYLYWLISFNLTLISRVGHLWVWLQEKTNHLVKGLTFLWTSAIKMACHVIIVIIGMCTLRLIV